MRCSSTTAVETSTGSYRATIERRWAGSSVNSSEDAGLVSIEACDRVRRETDRSGSLAMVEAASTLDWRLW